MGNRKKVLGLALLVLSFGSAVGQSPDASAKKKRHHFEVSVGSAYVGRAIGFVFYDKPVVQVSLTRDWGAGFYTGLWQSQPLDGSAWWSNFGYETDFTVGWAKGFKGIDFDSGSGLFLDPQ
ncbi:MAG: hypothetical protein COV31_00815 [Candidatus Yanofskybacteria bacterium CG10_big_fil_rev_8_21_14_0_10_46_23]|uniref:Uncharacterized protein n=1 Tax=Candidatus Yanofskybacteria bacterium CG10_big_fil_rev_8_21_14_0_10_46_23 TaxID=1975098 RepID=A0A2H0R4E2_9BACT|nr:MAG: hypothetical protein COV31_00815 [Candidatus Yanofskybacteria bacterium CG10_big_fil_rev_8_21_14_0_10_46_23]